MFLYGQATGGAPAPNPLGTMLVPILILVIFYVIMFLPMRRRQKQLQNKLGSLKGGERVLLNSGIYGTVTRIMDDRFEVEVASNTRIQVAKNAVGAVIDLTQEVK